MCAMSGLSLCPPRKLLVIERGVIDSNCIRGCPLSQLTPQRRGCVLEWVAQRIFERRCPDAMIQDPIPGERCEGRR